MEDWKECKLSDIVEINPTESLKKGTIAKKIGMDILQPFNRAIPFYTLEAFSGGTKFKNGDTIMARITPCLENGKTSMVNILDEGEIGFGSTEYIVFRAKENITDPYFIYYLVTSSVIREPAIKSMVGSSGRQRVQTDVVANLTINLPPLPTQQKIAQILSSLDDKIELNNKINANLEQQAQALFKSWFVDFEPFGGEMPAGWKVVPLEELCTVVTKGTTPTTLGKQFTEEGINFIKGESILDNHTFDLQKISHIDEATNTLLKRSVIEENDILFTIAGTLGRFAMIDDSLTPANTNQAVGIIRANQHNISPYFLYSFFIGNWHNDYYSKRIQQAVQANLSLGTIKSLPILIPDNSNMEKYTNVIEPIFKQMKQLENENKKLSNLRDTLLPKLMNGEIEI